jgi:hypothetical protein
MLRGQSQYVIYFRLFLELDLVRQKGMNMIKIFESLSCLSNRDVT